MQGMVSCKKKRPLLDLLHSMSAQHGETHKATTSWHSVWTMLAHVAKEFRLTSMYEEGTVSFENNVRSPIDMPTFMPPKPTRNGPGTKEPLPTMQKEGTRNTQERFIFIPHSKERRSWAYRVLGTRKI